MEDVTPVADTAPLSGLTGPWYTNPANPHDGLMPGAEDGEIGATPEPGDSGLIFLTAEEYEHHRARAAAAGGLCEVGHLIGPMTEILEGIQQALAGVKANKAKALAAEGLKRLSHAYGFATIHWMDACRSAGQPVILHNVEDGKEVTYRLDRSPDQPEGSADAP